MIQIQITAPAEEIETCYSKILKYASEGGLSEPVEVTMLIGTLQTPDKVMQWMRFTPTLYRVIQVTLPEAKGQTFELLQAIVFALSK